MIPKIIHYCWFGRGKMPALALKCIQSWKEILPDYEYMLWNEDSFDVTSNSYVKEAYDSKKYAFVTDYVRLYALYHVGGVYMDTDVEVLKRFDELLYLPAFSGFESDSNIPTGMMASEKNGKWVEELLNYYNNRHFLRSDGSCDLTTNTQTISETMKREGFKLKNSYQIHRKIVHIFPMDFFCAKSRSGLVTVTDNTYCIHHFAGSWNPRSQKIKKYIFQKILGPKLTDSLVKTKKRVKSVFRLQ